MANRTRNCQIKFDVTEEEKEIIEQKQKLSGITSKGAFYRKMILEGVVIKTDVSAIKDLTVSINRIGNNINQIARRTNQTGNIYGDDLKEINEKMSVIWELLKSTLSSQL